MWYERIDALFAEVLRLKAAPPTERTLVGTIAHPDDETSDWRDGILHGAEVAVEAALKSFAPELPLRFEADGVWWDPAPGDNFVRSLALAEMFANGRHHTVRIPVPEKDLMDYLTAVPPRDRTSVDHVLLLRESDQVDVGRWFHERQSAAGRNTCMRRTMQVLSDVHLEKRAAGWRLPPTKAPTLVLAGDIGAVADCVAVFREAAARWTSVLFVPGNHEYYGARAVPETRAALEAACAAHDNVHFLDNGAVTVEGQRFVGSTLWASPPATKSMTDFAQCNGLTLCGMQKLNAEAKAYLRATVRPDDVVITHFMPLTTTRLIELGHPSAFKPSATADLYFGNEGLEDVVRTARLWISGHTHQAFDVQVGPCRWLCNPIGVPHEKTGAEPEGAILNLN